MPRTRIAVPVGLKRLGKLSRIAPEPDYAVLSLGSLTHWFLGLRTCDPFVPRARITQETRFTYSRAESFEFLVIALLSPQSLERASYSARLSCSVR